MTSWRDAALARMNDEVLDVLVVGGGATGAAVARDAVLRGLTVGLCERGDFASETSSHSTKLIHGGLRYLEHGHLPLVFEALSERARLLRNAPHLCRPLEFVFPVYRGESPSLPKLALGIALYDALALWRPPVQSRRLQANEAAALPPHPRTGGLTGAMSYMDCQTDDARLVLETVLDAEASGALVASYAEVQRPAPRRGHLHQVGVCDRLTGRVSQIRARALVNATGPFSDAFRGKGRRLRPTLGVHIVVDAQRVPTGGRGFVIRAPQDRRVMFVLPAGARTVIGTTDTDWRPPAGEFSGAHIQATAADVTYLLTAVNHAFPSVRLGPDDVVSTYAGLRPLLADDADHPSAASREHAIWVDEAGVLTVAGGKLTTYRRMAEEVVDHLVELLRQRGLDRPLTGCQTRQRALPGKPAADTAGALDMHELAADVRDRLLQAYGARAPQVAALAGHHPSLLTRLVPDLPYVRAEVAFAVQHDRACTVEDVLRRRVPLFRDDRDQGLGVAHEVAAVMREELDWSETETERSVSTYREAVALSRLWRHTPTAA